jgi:hypothetical protein
MAANTLTGLIPTLFAALDVISRELVGFIPAVTRNSSAARAAKDQTITYRVVPAMAASDISPAATPSDPSGVVLGTDTMTITKSRKVPFSWTGEEELSLMNQTMLDGGAQIDGVLRDEFVQAMRTLVNEVESDLGALYVAASRAYGTAGTAPFGTAGDLSDIAQVRKILQDNGAPLTDLHLVLGSTAAANLRGKQNVLFKVNEAGTEELLRRGVLGQLQGFDLHESAQVKDHTKGTGSGYLVNTGGGEAVGQTTITTDTGSGTIVAGDVVTFAGTTHKYIVKTALSGGAFVLNKPGLLVAEADDDAISVGNNYAANLAFARSAIHLVTRAPAMPKRGDAAQDVMEITDPVSGLAFQVALYPGYRQSIFEVGLAWGVKAAKSEHMAILLG